MRRARPFPRRSFRDFYEAPALLAVFVGMPWEERAWNDHRDRREAA